MERQRPFVVKINKKNGKISVFQGKEKYTIKMVYNDFDELPIETYKVVLTNYLALKNNIIKPDYEKTMIMNYDSKEIKEFVINKVSKMKKNHPNRIVSAFIYEDDKFKYAFPLTSKGFIDEEFLDMLMDPDIKDNGMFRDSLTIESIKEYDEDVRKDKKDIIVGSILTGLSVLSYLLVKNHALNDLAINHYSTRSLSAMISAGLFLIPIGLLGTGLGLIISSGLFYNKDKKLLKEEENKLIKR